jgi:DNA-binding NtrC family response regulator
VIAATHRDLKQLVSDGQFREDLYYRLNVIPIRVPSLRERREDIDELILHFIEKARRPGQRPRVPDDVLAALRRYDWPGNVRELENAVQRALAMSVDNELTLEDFCVDLRPRPPLQISVRDEAREREGQELRELIISNGGNLSRAARVLGIPRTTLVTRASKLGLI